MRGLPRGGAMKTVFKQASDIKATTRGTLQHQTPPGEGYSTGKRHPMMLTGSCQDGETLCYLAPESPSYSFVARHHLHQPCGLTSPSTTLHDRGGSNNVQVAHMLMPLG
jgi:hypothetical protein